MCRNVSECRRPTVTAMVAVMFTVALATAVGAQEVFDEGDGVFATRPLMMNHEFATDRVLKVVSVASLSGDLVIRTAAVDSISVRYVKKAKTDRISRAIDYIDLIAVDLKTTPNTVILQIRGPNPPPWNERIESALVDAEIVIPESTTVEIDAAYFNVSAEGPYRAVIIPSSLGRLEISDVAGRLDITTANRRVWVRNISGDISVTTSNSTLTAEQINCPEGQARFRNEGGEIRIDDVSGGLNVRNTFGSIEINGFRPGTVSSFVRGQSGPILVNVQELGESRLVLNNRYEDIEIGLPADLSATLSLAVDDDGRIEVDGFTFITDLVEHNRLKLVAGDSAATISATVQGKGNIWARGIEQGE